MGDRNVKAESDFLQGLGKDVLLLILCFLNDPADIVRTSSVSHFYYNFVISSDIAKKLCLKMFPQLSNIDRDVRNEKLKERIDMMSNDEDYKVLKINHVFYSALLQAMISPKVLSHDCISNGVLTTSLGNFPDNVIKNTLNPQNAFATKPSYWLSKGTTNPDMPEVMIYRMKSETLLISELNIRPLEAYFMPNNPIYSARSVRIRVGHMKTTSELGFMEFECEDPNETPGDKLFMWDYISPELPLKQENCVQRFNLPKPIICADSFLEVLLLGRVQMEESDGLFYDGVSYLQVSGRRLHPAFELWSQHGKERNILKYFPEKMRSIFEAP